MAETAAEALEEWTTLIVRFMRDHVRRSGAEGLVLGISGGVDSALVGALAVRALGPEHVKGLLMPAADSDPQDAEDGRLVCEHLDIEFQEVPIGPLVAGLETGLGPLGEPTQSNSKSRARMLALYAVAQQEHRLVCGTGNKSELLSGYFTKYGDGASDLLPIGDLYKTQVWELARHLGLPQHIIDKPPSAGLRPGQSDESDLGMRYDDLDAILKGIEFNRPPAAIAARTGQPLERVLDVAGRVRRSEHKRRTPLVPKLGARTVGIDWRRPVHWDA